MARFYFAVARRAQRQVRRAHFLELKRRNGALTEEQAELSQWMHANGYQYAVADNFKTAIEILKGWGAVRASVSV